MAIHTKPLYNVDDAGVTIRRGPSDILWFGQVFSYNFIEYCEHYIKK